MNNPALEQLRALARGKVHGGYRWMAVMADEECICEACVTKEYKLIYRATRYPTTAPDNAQWQCIGITNSGEAESNENCAHCGRLYFEVERDSDPENLDPGDRSSAFRND